MKSVVFGMFIAIIITGCENLSPQGPTDDQVSGDVYYGGWLPLAHSGLAVGRWESLPPAKVGGTIIRLQIALRENRTFFADELVTQEEGSRKVPFPDGVEEVRIAYTGRWAFQQNDARKIEKDFFRGEDETTFTSLVFEIGDRRIFFDGQLVSDSTSYPFWNKTVGDGKSSLIVEIDPARGLLLLAELTDENRQDKPLFYTTHLYGSAILQSD
ncbi:MAG: hypothetical protein OYG31_01365 [Candidatus Kaiserbacteria bacterium]|nr:hypothetical protein [Candidatus Kaiserbacteria bacterium]